MSNWFAPLRNALFCPTIPWHFRWRLLILQPLALLTNAMKHLPNIFSQDYSVEWIPVLRRPEEYLRILIFRPGVHVSTSPNMMPPLHIDIHGGGFIGGMPDYDVPFCTKLAKRTGAIVLSISYRHAPRYTFPAAHEDVEDVVRYIIENAQQRFGADASMLTLSGFSAGGNLALAVAQKLGREIVKAIVTFYAPVDLRLPPWEKPKPINFPRKDPLEFLMPLFDAYAEPARISNLHNSILNPILAPRSALPKHIFMVIPTRDILLHEQTQFVLRLNEEADASADETVKTMFIEDQLHGWDQLPTFLIDSKTRDEAYDAAISFVLNVQKISAVSECLI